MNSHYFSYRGIRPVKEGYNSSFWHRLTSGNSTQRQSTMKVSCTAFLLLLPTAEAQIGVRERKLKSSKSSKGKGYFFEDIFEPETGGGEGGCIGASIKQPPIPGILPGKDKPKLILAQDVDFPPLAMLGPEEEDFPMSGFTADFAAGMQAYCDIDVKITQTQWVKCWDSDRIGDSLSRGDYHACSSYVQTAGVRNRYLEFSLPILADVAPAGILTRLVNGVPVVDGNSDLSNLTIVDVIGFAPTEDNLALVTNPCTGEKFKYYNVIGPDTVSNFPPDDALKTLLAGNADAMWTTADMVERYKCHDLAVDDTHDCTLWDKIGTEIAWVQTGMYGWAKNGTTLTAAKIGSGVNELVNPCIEAFLPTKEYYDLCVKYNLVQDCFQNEFFPTDAVAEVRLYDLPTNELTTTCADGYCPCP